MYDSPYSVSCSSRKCKNSHYQRTLDELHLFLYTFLSLSLSLSLSFFFNGEGLPFFPLLSCWGSGMQYFNDSLLRLRIEHTTFQNLLRKMCNLFFETVQNYINSMVKNRISKLLVYCESFISTFQMLLYFPIAYISFPLY